MAQRTMTGAEPAFAIRSDRATTGHRANSVYESVTRMPDGSSTTSISSVSASSSVSTYVAGSPPPSAGLPLRTRWPAYRGSSTVAPSGVSITSAGTRKSPTPGPGRARPTGSATRLSKPVNGRPTCP